MKLIVQLDSGEMFETKAKSSESLEAVKRAVEAQTNVPPEKQKLYFGGTELLDAQTLAHSLWDALKKVAGTEDEDGKLDLRTVKQMCSPATSPRSRGMSPVRSTRSLTDPSGGGEVGMTTSTLNAVAAKLGPDGDRGVSPHRRMAANRLAVKYRAENGSFDDSEGGMISPEAPSSPMARAETTGGLESEMRGGFTITHESGKSEGQLGEGFTGYHDDMIL